MDVFLGSKFGSWNLCCSDFLNSRILACIETLRLFFPAKGKKRVDWQLESSKEGICCATPCLQGMSVTAQGSTSGLGQGKQLTLCCHQEVPGGWLLPWSSASPPPTPCTPRVLSLSTLLFCCFCLPSFPDSWPCWWHSGLKRLLSPALDKTIAREQFV